MSVLPYIATNHALKQIYLGTTCLDLNEIYVHLKRNTPAPIRHWDLEGNPIEIELVAANMPLDDIVKFQSYYAEHVTTPGWKTLSCCSQITPAGDSSGKFNCATPECHDKHCPFRPSESAGIARGLAVR